MSRIASRLSGSTFGRPIGFRLLTVSRRFKGNRVQKIVVVLVPSTRDSDVPADRQVA
jgi:hypothetical protein